MSLITGKDCSLTIATKPYTSVISSFELKFDQATNDYAVLGQDDPLTYASKVTGTLSITFATDIDQQDGLWHALWKNAGKSIDYVAKFGGATMTGKAIAAQPGVTANAGEVSETTVELILDGLPVPSGSPAKGA